MITSSEKNKNQPRTFRLSDAAWTEFQRLAEVDNRTASEALQLLVQGYIEGRFRLPEVRLVWDEGGGRGESV